jgi:hypothetical protein
MRQEFFMSKIGKIGPVLILFLSGCVGSGMRIPGPTRHLSGVPPMGQLSLPVAGSNQKEMPGVRTRSNRDARQISSGATAWVGKSRLRHNGTTFRYDCSGFVNAAHALAGEDLAHRNTAGMVKYAKSLGLYERVGSPGQGDTVFWDNTHDRNKNGRLDDTFTHVGVVERVDADGTLHLVHLGSKGVVRIRMNLLRPNDYKNDSGKVLNSFLRRRTKSDRRGTQYLSAQLYSGMASFWAAGTVASLD